MDSILEAMGRSIEAKSICTLETTGNKALFVKKYKNKAFYRLN